MNNISIVNIERSVLSTFFYDYIVLDDIKHILKKNDFYLNFHQNIYETLIYLSNENLPIDIDFIKKQMKLNQNEERSLLEIYALNPLVNVHSYIEEIIEASQKRKLIKIVNKIKKQIIKDELKSNEILLQINNEINNLEKENISNNIFTAQEIIEQVKKDMVDARKNNQKRGQKSGLKALDNIIGSFEDGDLIIIAARPSMGKTSLISALTIQMLQDGNGVLIESLEMPAKKIMARLLSAKTGEKLSDLKQGVVKDLNNFNEAVNFFANTNLFIDDNINPTIVQLESKIRSLLRKNPQIKNVFIDHTGKILLPGQTREDIEIGHITNSLKRIARYFNIRIFLLQQLNRSVESRDNKRPMLSDLKNSGNIEEDADLVLGLYRDSYYKTKENGQCENKVEDAEILVLKNRDGATRTAKVAFEGQCARFLDRKELNTHVIIEFKD
jgi:replicative DNA helicase